MRCVHLSLCVCVCKSVRRRGNSAYMKSLSMDQSSEVCTCMYLYVLYVLL